VFFRKIVSEGLAHNSYIVGSKGVAVVIDPRRDCEIYLDIAREQEFTITSIFETHRNEDYCIGSLDLAGRCGAKIYHGNNPAFLYGNPVKEGMKFTLGLIELAVLETPGHTEDSISLALTDKEVADQPYMIFCGDTLFAGDIARTDFYGDARKGEMAAKIFDSISLKILALGDGVIICPAHGAGSVCGEMIADHPFTTAGYERLTNPSLILGRSAFIAEREHESPYYPPYFRTMEDYNSKGPSPLSRFPEFFPLPIAEVNKLRASGCQIIDIRSPTSFAAGHIPKSLSIWRDGLASFMGWFLDYEKPIIIVDDFNLELSSVFPQFVRLGYDNVAGYLAGGFSAWSKAGQETEMIPGYSAQQLKERLLAEKIFLLDVRDIKNRAREGSIPGSQHRYIGELPHHLDEIPHNIPIVAYCDSGYKGSMATSILVAQGYSPAGNLLGGIAGWKRAGFEIEH